MAILVETLSDTTFKVTVTAATTTTHTVTVQPAVYQRLTGGKVPAAMLVEKSFAFLLAREPNTSILSRFDLTVIGQYFPEYETTIPGMLA